MCLKETLGNERVQRSFHLADEHLTFDLNSLKQRKLSAFGRIRVTFSGASKAKKSSVKLIESPLSKGVGGQVILNKYEIENL